MKLLKLIGFIIIFFSIFRHEAGATISLSSTDPAIIKQSTPSITFTFTSNNNDFTTNHSYTFNYASTNILIGISNLNYRVEAQNPNLLKVVVSPIHSDWETGLWKYTLSDGDEKLAQGTFTVYKTDDLPAIYMGHRNFQAHTKQDIIVLNGQEGRFEYRFWYEGDPFHLLASGYHTIDPGGGRNFSTKIDMGDPSSAPKAICMTYNSFFAGGSALNLACDFRLFPITITSQNLTDPGEPIKSNETGTPSPGATGGFGPVRQFPSPSPICKGGFCETALGKIFTDPANFVKGFFGILLSLAGGIAIILIILSGYRLMSSGGNPEKVQAAREQLTSAIVGLLFIIFSLSILQIIGVNILHIPGLSP